MAPVGKVRARAMFGGFGIYQEDIMFAIVVDDRLYFKADGATYKKFTARNPSQFTYVARGKIITMQYFEAPPEVFEAPVAMRIWAQQSIAAALRARKDKQKC
ncbi:MAG: TfoX/Sxy family protein [Burkholderiales bacterium]